MLSFYRHIYVLLPITLGVLLFLFSSSAHAANPTIINFQGKVVNADGTNVADGAYNFDFVLYDDPTLGSPSDGVHDKWHELTKSVQVRSGVFQTNLGSATSFSGFDFNANSNLYLAVRFNADANGYMTPRVQMSSVPYAFNADKVGGFSASQLVQLSPGVQQTGFINVSGNVTSGGNLAVTGTYNTNTFSSSALQFGAASTATIQSAASQALNITGHAASILSTDAGTMTVQGFSGLTLKSANAATGGTSAVSLLSGDATTSGATGAISIASGNATSGTAGNVNIDVGTSSTGNGSILIGGASRTQTITIGNSTGGAIRVGQNGSTVQIDGTNFDVSTGGVITLAGGQNPDITTAAATSATAIVIQPGASSGGSSNGAAVSIKGGDGSGTTSVTGGAITIQAGSATAGSGTRNGGSVTIDAGTGGTANGAISLGTTNATGVSIGKSAGTLTLLGATTLNNNANNNVDINTGSSTGTITLGGGSAPVAINSTNFDVTTAGVVSGITGLTMASGNFLQNGTGTFGTGSGNVSLNGATSVTGSNTFSVAGGLTTLSAGLTATGTTNINATGTADTNIGNSTGTTAITGKVTVTAPAAPTTDQVTISNVGQAVATAGVSGLQINYVGGTGAIESSAQRIDFTPGGTSGSTWNGLRIVANATGPASGVTGNGIKLEGPTSAGAGTEVGIRIDANWDAGLQLGSKSSDPGTPAADNIYVYARKIAGRSMLRQKGSSGVAFAYQPAIFEQAITYEGPNTTTTVTSFGSSWTVDTTASHPAADQVFGYATNFATAATTNDTAGVAEAATQHFRGSVAGGANGFFYVARMGLPDANYGTGATGARIWTGLTSGTAASMTNADNPAGSYAGFQYSTNRGDTAWQFITKDGTTQSTPVATLTIAQNKVYDFYVYTPPQGTTIYWRIDNLTDGTTQEGSTTTNLPVNTTALRAGTSLQTLTTTARNIRVLKHYVESDR